MGFIRGSLFVIVSVLLFLSMLSAGFFYMISISLDYDIVKDELVSSAEEMVGDMGVYDDFVNNFGVMQEYCSGNSVFKWNEGGTYNIPCEVISEGSESVIDYISTANPSDEVKENINSNYNNLVSYCNNGDIFSFDYEENNFEIPCDIINQGVDEVFSYALEDFVMEAYYSEYDCSLLNCFEETGNPSFLISEKTMNYSSQKLYFLILVSLGLIALMFVLIEKRSNLPFVVGGLLVVASLPFMKLDSVLTFIDDKLILSFVSVFLTKTYSVFTRFILLGVSVIGLGIIWKFFIIGFKINGFVSWIKKKIEERKKRKKDKLGKEKGQKKDLSLKKNVKGEIGLSE